MAFIRNNQQSEEENKSAVTPTLGGTASNSSVGSGTGTGESSGSSGNPNAGDSFIDPSKIAEQNADVGVDNLLKGLYGQRDSARQAFTGAQADFNSKSGIVPTFGQAEQTNLSNYLNTGQGKDTAQGYLNAKYTGPGADFYDTDNRANSWNSFGGAVRNLGSTSGLQSYLQSINPNSNQGERRFDALLYGKNPQFQSAAKSLADDWTNLENQIGGAKASAQTAVDERTKGAQNVQTASRDYVGNYRSDIGNQVQSRLNNELGYLNNPKHDASNYTDITGVNPNAYRRNLQASELPTFASMINQDEAGRFNRAGELLGYDAVTPSDYSRPNLFNEDALMAALQNVERRYSGGSFRDFMEEGGRADNQRGARAAGYTGAFGEGGYTNYSQGYANPTGEIYSNLLGGQYTDANSIPQDVLANRLAGRQSGYAGDWGAGGYNNYSKGYGDQTGQIFGNLLGGQYTDASSIPQEVLANRLAARNSGYTGDWGAGGYSNYSQGYADNQGNINSDLLGGRYTEAGSIPQEVLSARKEARDRGYTGEFGSGGYDAWKRANGY